MNQLKRLWSDLRASFWFLPTSIVVFSTVLAVGLIEVDYCIIVLRTIRGGDEDGFRNLLIYSQRTPSNHEK